MKSNSAVKKFFGSNLIMFLASLAIAVAIWLYVVINVSPQATRVIKDVKVNIDQTVPSQFGLEVFGKSDFKVDVTVEGKKYQISTANLTAEDIVVTAITNDVDSAGKRTLQLKAEPVSENADYTISSISLKMIDVYFDTPKTVEFVIEPEIVTNGFPIVKAGYSSGDINLSQTSVLASGPATQINGVKKVVARYVLGQSLTSNMSVETELIPLDDNNENSFDEVDLDIKKVVLTIPVLRTKELDTIITFKNAPDAFVLDPLSYTISPSREEFNIVVDEYDKVNDYSVGTVDFKELSPGNNVFTFDAANTALANDNVEEFLVEVDMTGFLQEYFTFSAEKIKLNHKGKKKYKVSGLDKSIVIIGTEEALKSVTEESISVEVDLSGVEIEEGQSVNVPAIVSVDNPSCWVFGTYMVEISL